jgi:hypothetical protein
MTSRLENFIVDAQMEILQWYQEETPKEKSYNEHIKRAEESLKFRLDTGVKAV